MNFCHNLAWNDRLPEFRDSLLSILSGPLLNIQSLAGYREPINELRLLDGLVHNRFFHFFTINFALLRNYYY